eukprot:g48968.t1
MNSYRRGHGKCLFPYKIRSNYRETPQITVNLTATLFGGSPEQRKFETPFHSFLSFSTTPWTDQTRDFRLKQEKNSNQAQSPTRLTASGFHNPLPNAKPLTSVALKSHAYGLTPVRKISQKKIYVRISLAKDTIMAISNSVETRQCWRICFQLGVAKIIQLDFDYCCSRNLRSL